ncbi:hypothetical protein MUK42_37159 [Musa troglodytarum]|uniref:Uncharacterized protein n=1 Tax=Musa troglodytarum TaxID=320322 RepID=A0A9E7GFS1_9LILI|nr:hypothetical protein MUK42_37159 [Musa troglodytarum]
MKQISGAYQSSYGDDEGGASFWRSLAALPLLTGWMSSSKPAQIRYLGSECAAPGGVLSSALPANCYSPSLRRRLLVRQTLSFFPQSSTED